MAFLNTFYTFNVHLNVFLILVLDANRNTYTSNLPLGGWVGTENGQDTKTQTVRFEFINNGNLPQDPNTYFEIKDYEGAFLKIYLKTAIDRDVSQNLS